MAEIVEQIKMLGGSGYAMSESGVNLAASFWNINEITAMKFIGVESGQALKLILSNELKGYSMKYEVVKAAQDLKN